MKKPVHYCLLLLLLCNNTLLLIAQDEQPCCGLSGHSQKHRTTFNTFFNKGWGYRLRDMVVQSTLEYRRALDYLETRKEIDSERIGAIGYSLGSVVTFIRSMNGRPLLMLQPENDTFNCIIAGMHYRPNMLLSLWIGS